MLFPPAEINSKRDLGMGLKLWDPRKQDAIRTYTQHFDFISDFMWLQDKKQLVATRCVETSPSLYPTPFPLFVPRN